MAEINSDEMSTGCCEKFRLKLKNVGDFIWNPRTREFCGRTAISWGQILLFYLIFYGLLACLFAICLAVCLATISKTAPTKQKNFSLLKYSPALQFSPQITGQTLINFRADDNSSNLVQLLRSEIHKYSDAQKSNLKNCTATDGATEAAACYYPLNWMGECSVGGLGYDAGMPCIMLRINRIFDWSVNGSTLEEGKTACDGSHDSSVPCQFNRISPEYKTVVKDNHIAVSCEGQSSSDNDNLHSVTFYPPTGIPSYFYPYLNQPHFLSPPLMARFNVTIGRAIMIWCRFWHHGVVHDLTDQRASVNFELLVDALPRKRVALTTMAVAMTTSASEATTASMNSSAAATDNKPTSTASRSTVAGNTDSTTTATTTDFGLTTRVEATIVSATKNSTSGV